MATLKAAHTELAVARYQFEKVAERKQRSVMRYMCVETFHIPDSHC